MTFRVIEHALQADYSIFWMFMYGVERREVISYTYVNLSSLDRLDRQLVVQSVLKFIPNQSYEPFRSKRQIMQVTFGVINRTCIAR